MIITTSVCLPQHSPASTIAGVTPQPRAYGRSASNEYYKQLQQAKDTFASTGSNAPFQALNRASFRYTPKDTVSLGYINDAAAENALGAAEIDIKHLDLNKDGGLTQAEIAQHFMRPFLMRIAQLQHLIQNPASSDRKRQKAQTEQDYLQLLGEHTCTVDAANFFTSVDVRDANGQSDGKLTTDELAARILLDDAALPMFQAHQASYQHHIETHPDDFEDSFQDLKNSIDNIARYPHAHPLAQDGQITPAEYDIADLLTMAPVPTNHLVSQLHQNFELKARLAAPAPGNT